MTKHILKSVIAVIIISSFLFSCHPKPLKPALSKEDSIMQAKVKEFAVVKLTTDLSKLTDKEKQMIPLLIEVAGIVDDLYWLPFTIPLSGSLPKSITAHGKG